MANIPFFFNICVQETLSRWMCAQFITTTCSCDTLCRCLDMVFMAMCYQTARGRDGWGLQDMTSQVGKYIISFNFIYNVLQIKQRNLLMSDLSERPGTLNISKERLFLCHRSVTSAYHSPSSHFHLLARVHYSSEFLFLVMVCRSEDVPDSSLLRRNSVLPASQRYHRNATRRDQVSIWVRDPNMYQLVSLFSLNI